MNKQIYNIIQTFRNNRFQKELQMRFRFWMRMDTDQEAKEEALQQIWEESPSVVSENTWKNLAEMKRRIAEENGRRSEMKILFNNISKYAAIILLVVASSTMSIWVYNSMNKETPPTFTECFVPYGEQREITLPDGSSAFINYGSILVYPERFEGEKRYVYLTGEARFEVTHNQEQPFVVRTDKLDIEVLGTVFNVQSYPDRENIAATLEEGIIKVYPKDNQAYSYTLKPDEQLTYSRITQSMEKHKVHAEDYSSWREGYLLFEKARFEEILFSLERKYNIRIHYNQEKFKGRRYNITFRPNESLEDALRVLSLLIKDLDYKKVDNTIFIN